VDDGAPASAIAAKVTEAETLLSRSAERSLTGEQREQAETIRALIDQARAALRDRDEERAAILAEKALLLSRDLERAARP
jgi:hypothetical protein